MPPGSVRPVSGLPSPVVPTGRHTMEYRFCEEEQPAGEPLVPVVDPEATDLQRRETYLSYEGFLRAHLEALDRRRPEQWRRDYSSVEAYLRSVAPMRARLKRMLGFW